MSCCSNQFTVDVWRIIRLSKNLEVAPLSNRNSLDTNDVSSFFRKEQKPSFISTPSSPLYPVENDNITLQWTYTLDGSPLDEVEVLLNPELPSAVRIARYRSGGTTQVANEIRDRFIFNLTDSQSTMTILLSQRSDSGTYELRVRPDVLNQAPIGNVVKISVKCKYNDFPCFLLETSTIIIIIMILNMRLMIFTLRLVVWTFKLVVVEGLT